MFEQLKYKIGLFFLNRKIKEQVRKVKVCSLDKANKVGVVFDVLDDKNYKNVKSFLKYLREEEGVRVVRGLGYVNEKELPSEFIPNAFIDFYTNSDVNWYLKPVSSVTNNFIEENFDILIDLSTEFSIPLKFLFIESKCKFKVGKFNKEVNFQSDLMIDIVEVKSLRYYIEQLTHYLKMINSKNNAA